MTTRPFIYAEDKTRATAHSALGVTTYMAVADRRSFVRQSHIAFLAAIGVAIRNEIRYFSTSTSCDFGTYPKNNAARTPAISVSTG